MEQLQASGIANADAGFKSLLKRKKELRMLAEQEAATPSAQGFITSSQKLDRIDALVPDASFAAVLNEDLEVQVGDKIYKITPQGTYFTSVSNVAMLEQVVATRINNRALLKEDKIISGYLYKVQDNIFRYDTYGEAAKRVTPVDASGAGVSTLDGPYDPPIEDPGTCIDCPAYEPEPYYPPVSSPNADCSFAQPPSAINFAIPQWQYCGIKSYAYESKTVVGGWLESVFGANSDHTENFDSDHRVKVKLYNFNYFVYSSLGLKVKFQKRGWTGIWDARDTEKLVIGWDAIIFETPHVYSAPYPYNNPGFPGKAVSKELLKFINFEVEAGTLTQLDESILGVDLYGAKDVSNALKGLSRQTLASSTKTIWNYANTQLNPGRQDFLNTQTKAFRLIFPDKMTTALSRWEISRDNNQEIDCLFDFNIARITFTGYLDGSFDWFQNVAVPTYNNKAFSYKVVEASVYGAAKYNGQWKGARVIQEKED